MSRGWLATQALMDGRSVDSRRKDGAEDHVVTEDDMLKREANFYKDNPSLDKGSVEYMPAVRMREWKRRLGRDSCDGCKIRRSGVGLGTLYTMVHSERCTDTQSKRCDCGAEKARTTHARWCTAYRGEADTDSPGKEQEND